MPIESDSAAAGPRAVSPFDALPGLATALDGDAMRGHVQAALFGPRRARYTVERCTPARPLYIPGDSCVLRYRVEARDGAGGMLEPLLTGRVFPDASASAAYASEKLAPPAQRMRGRREVADLAAPAAVVEPLNMTLSVWPVDGELPTLVEATDRRRMLDVFRELPAVAGREPLTVENCLVELVSYRRRQRCVLRYTLTGGAGEARAVVYGKVTGVGNETLASPLIEELRGRVRERGGGDRITLPTLLAWRPELRLALLQALPGEPRIRPAIRARLKSRPAPAGPPLEELVATCAEAAALLHGSGLEPRPVRSFDDELAALHGEVASAAHFAPELGARARSWLARVAEAAQASEPLALRLAHGDFNHGQVLFDEAAGAALLDLDTLCLAEPALDAGKFVAHLRAETEKLRRRASVTSALGDELAERFLAAYAAAAGGADEGRLRLRTALYEALALVRLAVRSAHDFEETRLEIASGLLEKRLAALPAGPPLSRPRT